MTTDEITALRHEFEDAIFTACQQFKDKTGVAVKSIDLTFARHWEVSKAEPENILAGASVTLESL